MLLGPEFSSRQCIDACRNHRDKPVWEELEDPHGKAVELLAAGELVGWFRGRLEFGQRALGNRSVLANPQQENNADLINQQVKFREIRRPFACSILAEASDEMLSGQQRTGTAVSAFASTKPGAPAIRASPMRTAARGCRWWTRGTIRISTGC